MAQRLLIGKAKSVFQREMAKAEQPENNPAAGDGKNAEAKSKSTKREGKRKYCALHGPGAHTTNECTTIHKLAESKRAANNQPTSNKQARFGNKKWVRDTGSHDKPAPSRATTTQSEELKAFAVKTIREELSAFIGKKRKKHSEEAHAYLETDESVDLEEFEQLRVDSNGSDDSDSDSTTNEVHDNFHLKTDISV